MDFAEYVGQLHNQGAPYFDRGDGSCGLACSIDASVASLGVNYSQESLKDCNGVMTARMWSEFEQQGEGHEAEFKDLGLTSQNKRGAESFDSQ